MLITQKEKAKPIHFFYSYLYFYKAKKSIPLTFGPYYWGVKVP